MWSLMIAGSLSSARSGDAAASARARSRSRLFMEETGSVNDRAGRDNHALLEFELHVHFEKFALAEAGGERIGLHHFLRGAQDGLVHLREAGRLDDLAVRDDAVLADAHLERRGHVAAIALDVGGLIPARGEAVFEHREIPAEFRKAFAVAALRRAFAIARAGAVAAGLRRVEGLLRRVAATPGFRSAGRRLRLVGWRAFRFVRRRRFRLRDFVGV